MSCTGDDSSTDVEKEKETKWTDACIRWENEQPKHHDDNDEQEERPFDPFADPDPTEQFSFRFPYQQSEISVSIDGYKADSDQTWQSTGLTLWRASHHLNDYILQHAAQWKGKRILELGAGLGICGILVEKVIAATETTATGSSESSSLNQTSGATFICLTDGDTDALPVLRQNVKQNCAPNINHSVICRQLLWGKDTSRAFGERHGTFDVILASDIVYAPQIVAPLWETIDTLLDTTKESIFVLAFARRKVPVQVENVLRAATESGFVNDCIKEDEDGVFLYEFRRK